MTRRLPISTFALLGALSWLGAGCTYVRDARLCVEVGELMNGVSSGPPRVTPTEADLHRQAARYRQFKEQLHAIGNRSPKRLQFLFNNLAKESGYAQEALERASTALEQRSAASYAAQRRSLEATVRRMEIAGREIRRTCGAE